MLFWAVVSDSTEEPVELFTSREEAAAIVQAWDRDEPDQAGALRAEKVAYGELVADRAPALLPASLRAALGLLQLRDHIGCRRDNGLCRPVARLGSGSEPRSHPLQDGDFTFPVEHASGQFFPPAYGPKPNLNKHRCFW
jgi:hypothetical protein